MLRCQFGSLLYDQNKSSIWIIFFKCLKGKPDVISFKKKSEFEVFYRWKWSHKHVTSALSTLTSPDSAAAAAEIETGGNLIVQEKRTIYILRTGRVGIHTLRGIPFYAEHGVRLTSHQIFIQLIGSRVAASTKRQNIFRRRESIFGSAAKDISLFWSNKWDESEINDRYKGFTLTGTCSNFNCVCVGWMPRHGPCVHRVFPALRRGEAPPSRLGRSPPPITQL